MIRSGIGYDVHRFVEGRRLVLGGVDIAYELGLLGHSDADVVVHALIDALLGAVAAGDIGKFFPDTAPQWKDASSIDLLRRVCTFLDASKWRIGNVDVTIICETPKLAPFILAMRTCLAEALCVGVDAVSVKATTVEGLGAIGRQEGIAAQAIATVVRDRSAESR